MSFNMAKLYRNLNLKKKKKPKSSYEKVINSLVGFATGLSDLNSIIQKTMGKFYLDIYRH